MSRKRVVISAAVVLTLILGVGAYVVASTWGDVNRVAIDRPADGAGGVVAQEDPDEPKEVDDEGEPAASPDNPGTQAILLVGSDSRADLEDLEGFGDFEGARADVVMVLIQDGSRTALLSLPRDLLVDDVCSGGQAKLTVMLEGCDEMNGPSLLLATVEKVIDQPVDHFAMVDLAGFQEAVDAVGGYEICVDRPVRDSRANLQLPAGCTDASGEQTLAWLRSRRTQELTESGWRTMPGVNDLVRNERQRAFLIDMMSRVSDFSSPQAMRSVAQSVAPFVTVDSEFSLVEAIDLALTMRGFGTASVVELDVPMYDSFTDAGEAVLLPSVPVEEVVADFLSASIGGGSAFLDVGP